MTTVWSNLWDIDTHECQKLLDNEYKSKRAKINICKKAKNKQTAVEVKRIDLGWMLSDRMEFRDLAVSIENFE